MALAVTMIALVLIGALVAVAFQAAHLEQRTAHHSLYSAQALEAAEAGIVDVLGGWAVHPGVGSLEVGGSLALASVPLGPRAGYQATVARLTESLYLIRSRGSSVDAEDNLLAERHVSTLARAAPAGAVPLVQRSWIQGP
jgi:hypothetical protein